MACDSHWHQVKMSEGFWLTNSVTTKCRLRHTVPVVPVLQAASLFSGQMQAQSNISDFSSQMFLIQEDGLPSPFQFVHYINRVGEVYTLSPEPLPLSYLTAKAIYQEKQDPDCVPPKNILYWL